MTKKLLLLCAMLLAATACSGEQQDELGTECDTDEQCPSGSVCEKGFCSGSSNITGDAGPLSVDGGMKLVEAAGEAAGLPPGESPVTVEADGCPPDAASCDAIEPGSRVTFTAAEVEGYRFTGWSGSPQCMGTDPVLVIEEIDANTMCIANYVKRVVVSGSGPGTLVATTKDGNAFDECSGAECEVDRGIAVVITADPRNGFRFDGFSGAGCEMVDASARSVTVPTSGNLDVTCTAVWVQTFDVSGAVEGVNATVQATPGAGTASCDMDECTVDAGGSVTLTAPNVSGYRFAGWSGGEGCTGTSASITLSDVRGHVTCVASYVQRFVVEGLAEGTPDLSVLELVADDTDATCDAASGSCEVDAESMVAITAPTVPGYRFAGFTGAGCENVSGSTATVGPVTADVTCVASYVEGIAVIGNVAGAPGTVNAVATAAQSPCANGACVIDEGSNVTLTAPTPAGYRFLGWTGSEGCESSELSITLVNVTESKTCTANFVPRVTITGQASPAQGGTIAASSNDANGQCSGGTCTVDEGFDVTLEAVAASGYRFTGWSGDGVCTGTANPLVIADVTGPRTCTASFVARHTVSFPNPTGGSVAASNVPATATCSGASCVVDSGAGLRLTATADAGYRFTGWSGCSTSPNAQLDLSNIASNLTCTANFTRRYTVSFPNPTGGSIAASNTPANATCNATSCVVDQGAALRLTATEDSFYRFTGWTGCSTSTNPQLDLSNIASDLSCTANFVRRVTVSFPDPAGGAVAASNVPSTGVCDATSCVLDTGASLRLTATADTGYRFTGWTGCSTSGNPQLDLSNVASNVTCTATFVRRFTVAFPDPASGSIAASNVPATGTCTNASCVVDSGAGLRLSASADAGYRFSGWSGCSTSTSAQLDLSNISSDLTCTANFVRQVNVTYTASAGGSVAAPAASCPSGSPCTLDTGASLNVTATPSAGYRFNGWTGTNCTDNDTSTPRVMNLVGIDANVTCTASFVRQFQVTYSAGTGGSVSAPSAQCPNGSPCTLDTGSSVDLTATASAGYRFNGWTGTGCTDSDTSTANVADLVSITNDVTCTASFVQQFQVTYTAGTGGTVSAPSAACPSGSPCTVDTGASLNLTANASAGYRFNGWTGTNCTDDNTASPLVMNLVGIDANVACTASFVRQFQVTYAAGTGGSVSAPSARCPNGSPCTIDSGSNLDVTATANAGYRFNGWTGTGCTDNDTSTASVADLVGITSDVTCTASFVQQFQVTYSAGTGGSVSAPAAACPSGSPCTLDAASSLNITATANAGYRFNGWTGTGCTDNNTATPLVMNLVGISSNVTCAASFVRQFQVTYSAGTGGSVSAPSGTCPNGSPCTLDTGSNVDLTATASAGYRFNGWSGTGCTDSDTNTANVADLVDITSNVTCTASFVQQFQVTYSAGTGGSISAPSAACPSGSPCTVDSGANLNITATASAGYRFNGWTGTNCTDNNTASLLVMNLVGIDANVTCTASFVRQFQVTYTAGTGGSVSAPSARCPNGSPCTVDTGTGLDVTATVNAGYRFNGWTGTGCNDSDTNTPLVADLVSITSDVTCTASFVQQFQVTYSAGNGGSVSAPSAACPTGSPCTVDTGAGLNITATANNGYRFNGWTGTNCTDNATNTPNVMNLVGIDANVTCTASFVRQFQVTYTAGTGGTVAAPSARCPNGSPCTVDTGTGLDITATVNAGYRFNGWTGTGCTDGDTSTPLVADLGNITSTVTCTASFVQQFQVTYAAGNGGSVSAPAASCPSGSPCTVDSGANLNVTATATTGYRFNGWTGTNCTDNDTSTPRVANLVGIDANVTCTANFVRQFQVTYTAGTGGSVAAPSATCPNGSPCTLDTGSSVDITATANTGYRFNGWTGTGCTDSDTNTANVADLVSITSDVTCTASFVQQLQVTYTAGTGGTVSAPAASCPSGSPCTVDTGASLNITATANNGYRFNGWTGTNCTDNATNTPNVMNLVGIDANVTCTASFVRQFQVTYTAGTGGTVAAPSARCPNGSPCTVDTGTGLDITATVNAGYRFNGWTGTGCTDSDTSTPLVADLVNITSTVTCTASFTRQFQVTYTATAGGSVSAPTASCPNGSPCTVDSGAGLNITATVTNGYRFNGWTGTGCTDSATNTPLVMNLVNITSDVTCRASFVRQYTVSYTATTGGTVSAPSNVCPSGSPCTVDTGTAVAITATPNTGYRLSGWSGTGCTDSNANTPNVIELASVTSDVTCNPSFTRQYTVTYSANTGGTVTAPAASCPNGSPCAVDDGFDLAITATASNGYRFVSWTGTGCTDSTPATANIANLTGIASDITCTANFIPQWTIASALPTSPAGVSVSAASPGNSAPAAVCTNPTGGAGSCLVDQGLSVILTAAAVANHVVTGWTGTGCTDAGSDNNAATLQINNVAANRTCTPTYARRYRITGVAAATTPVLGSVDVSTADTFATCTGVTNGEQCDIRAGQSATLDAIPSNTSTVRARFTGWSGGCTGTTDPYALSNIAADASCTASFQRQWRVAGDLTGAPAGATVTVASPNNTAPNAVCSALSNGVNNCIVDNGLSVTFTAPNLTLYVVTGWTGHTACSNVVAPRNPTTITLNNVTSDITCRPIYTRRRVTVTAQKSPISATGTMSISSNDPNASCSDLTDVQGLVYGRTCTIDMGSTVTVGATEDASSSYRFGRWSSDACGGSSFSGTFVADASTDCTANYYGLWARLHGYTPNDFFQGLHQIDESAAIAVGTAAANGNRGRFAQFNPLTGALSNGQELLQSGPSSTALQVFDVDGIGKNYCAVSQYVMTSTRPILHGFGDTPFTVELTTSSTTQLDHVTALSGGGYLASGYSQIYVGNTSQSAGRAVRITSTGALGFDRSVQMPNSCGQRTFFSTQVKGIAALRNFVAVVSNAEVPDSNNLTRVWVTALKASDGADHTVGSAVLERYFVAPDDLEAYGAWATPEGELLVFGRILEPPPAPGQRATNYDAYVAKLDANLEMVWDLRIENPNVDDMLMSATLASDGKSYALAGYVNRTDVRARAIDGLLVEVTPEGQLQLQQAIGTTAVETFTRVRAGMNGGYLFTGMNYTNQEWAYDGWLVRTDSDGSIKFNSNVTGSSDALALRSVPPYIKVQPVGCSGNNPGGATTQAVSLPAGTNSTPTHPVAQAP